MAKKTDCNHPEKDCKQLTNGKLEEVWYCNKCHVQFVRMKEIYGSTEELSDRSRLGV